MAQNQTTAQIRQSFLPDSSLELVDELAGRNVNDAISSNFLTSLLSWSEPLSSCTDSSALSSISFIMKSGVSKIYAKIT